MILYSSAVRLRQLMVGNLCKSALGSSKSGLVYAILRNQGPTATGELLDKIARISARYLGDRYVSNFSLLDSVFLHSWQNIPEAPLSLSRCFRLPLGIHGISHVCRLPRRGFSIGLDDVTPSESLTFDKALTLEEGYTDCDEVCSDSSHSHSLPTTGYHLSLHFLSSAEFLHQSILPEHRPVQSGEAPDRARLLCTGDSGESTPRTSVSDP